MASKTDSQANKGGFPAHYIVIIVVAALAIAALACFCRAGLWRRSRNKKRSMSLGTDVEVAEIPTTPSKFRSCASSSTAPTPTDVKATCAQDSKAWTPPRNVPASNLCSNSLSNQPAFEASSHCEFATKSSCANEEILAVARNESPSVSVKASNLQSHFSTSNHPLVSNMKSSFEGADMQNISREDSIALLIQQDSRSNSNDMQSPSALTNSTSSSLPYSNMQYQPFRRNSATQTPIGFMTPISHRNCLHSVSLKSPARTTDSGLALSNHEHCDCQSPGATASIASRAWRCSANNSDGAGTPQTFKLSNREQIELLERELEMLTCSTSANLQPAKSPDAKTDCFHILPKSTFDPTYTDNGASMLRSATNLVNNEREACKASSAEAKSPISATFDTSPEPIMANQSSVKQPMCKSSALYASTSAFFDVRERAHTLTKAHSCADNTIEAPPKNIGLKFNIKHVKCREGSLDLERSNMKASLKHAKSTPVLSTELCESFGISSDPAAKIRDLKSVEHDTMAMPTLPAHNYANAPVSANSEPIGLQLESQDSKELELFYGDVLLLDDDSARSVYVKLQNAEEKPIKDQLEEDMQPGTQQDLAKSKQKKKAQKHKEQRQMEAEEGAKRRELRNKLREQAAAAAIEQLAPAAEETTAYTDEAHDAAQGKTKQSNMKPKNIKNHDLRKCTAYGVWAEVGSSNANEVGFDRSAPQQEEFSRKKLHQPPDYKESQSCAPQASQSNVVDQEIIAQECSSAEEPKSEKEDVEKPGNAENASCFGEPMNLMERRHSVTVTTVTTTVHRTVEESWSWKNDGEAGVASSEAKENDQAEASMADRAKSESSAMKNVEVDEQATVLKASTVKKSAADTSTINTTQSNSKGATADSARHSNIGIEPEVEEKKCYRFSELRNMFEKSSIGIASPRATFLPLSALPGAEQAPPAVQALAIPSSHPALPSNEAGSSEPLPAQLVVAPNLTQASDLNSQDTKELDDCEQLDDHNNLTHTSHRRTRSLGSRSDSPLGKHHSSLHRHVSLPVGSTLTQDTAKASGFRHSMHEYHEPVPLRRRSRSATSAGSSVSSISNVGDDKNIPQDWVQYYPMPIKPQNMRRRSIQCHPIQRLSLELCRSSIILPPPPLGGPVPASFPSTTPEPRLPPDLTSYLDTPSIYVIPPSNSTPSVQYPPYDLGDEDAQFDDEEDEGYNFDQPHHPGPTNMHGACQEWTYAPVYYDESACDQVQYSNYAEQFSYQYTPSRRDVVKSSDNRREAFIEEYELESSSDDDAQVEPAKPPPYRQRADLQAPQVGDDAYSNAQLSGDWHIHEEDAYQYQYENTILESPYMDSSSVSDDYSSPSLDGTGSDVYLEMNTPPPSRNEDHNGPASRRPSADRPQTAGDLFQPNKPMDFDTAYCKQQFIGLGPDHFVKNHEISFFDTPSPPYATEDILGRNESTENTVRHAKMTEDNFERYDAKTGVPVSQSEDAQASDAYLSSHSHCAYLDALDLQHQQQESEHYAQDRATVDVNLLEGRHYADSPQEVHYERSVAKSQNSKVGNEACKPVLIKSILKKSTSLPKQHVSADFEKTHQVRRSPPASLMYMRSASEPELPRLPHGSMSPAIISPRPQRSLPLIACKAGAIAALRAQDGERDSSESNSSVAYAISNSCSTHTSSCTDGSTALDSDNAFSPKDARMKSNTRPVLNTYISPPISTPTSPLT